MTDKKKIEYGNIKTMKAFDTAFHEMMNTEICFDENRKRMNQLLIRQNENNYAWFCIGESGIKKKMDIVSRKSHYRKLGSCKRFACGEQC